MLLTLLFDTVIEATTQNGMQDQPSFQLIQQAEMAAASERRPNRSTSAPTIPVTSSTLQVPSTIPGLNIVRDPELSED